MLVWRKKRVEDYKDREEMAISILGRDTVETIIMNFPESQDLLYELGGDIIECERIGSMIRNGQSVKALLALSDIHSKGEGKPKQRFKKSIPEPDDPIEGGKGSSPDMSDLMAKKLDTLRDKAASGTQADLDALFKYKQGLKKKGIQLK